jgi:hypothetical protein
MELKITCSAQNTIDYKLIIPFQGNLKRRGDRDIEKLCASIIEHGISFPFVLWRYDNRYGCIDGHGRLLAFAELEKQGYTIPPVPYVEIYAETKEEAIKKLLYKNCKYGDMTYQSVMEFVGDSNLNMTNFQLPTGKMLYKSGTEFDPGSFEIVIPKYTPEVDVTGEGSVPAPSAEKHTFRLGKVEIDLTDEESKMLTNELNFYARENNGLFGFVSYLFGG